MRKYSTGILTAILAIVAFTILSCNRNKNCCKQYDPSTDQSTYCNKHRSAAYEFVQNDDGSLSRDRYQQFKNLCDKIKNCGDIACIETAIKGDPLLARLDSIYANEHAKAEERTHLPDSQKSGLILCGFSNAIDDIDANLKQEGK